jgi:hypothetical protein
MASTQQDDQQLLDHLLETHDHSAHLAQEILVMLVQVLHRLEFVLLELRGVCVHGIFSSELITTAEPTTSSLRCKTNIWSGRSFGGIRARVGGARRRRVEPAKIIAAAR